MAKNNPFEGMTRNIAEADEMWEAFKVSRNEAGDLVIFCKTEAEIRVPASVLDANAKEINRNGVGKVVAQLFYERVDLDQQEFEIILRHKIDAFLEQEAKAR